MNKPNIVYFVADQMRNDALAHMGNPASHTPNLDDLLNEGVSFRNAYCQNPVCVPSRCSFLTGLYPHTTGHRTMHFLQNPDEPNIMKEMKNNGYEVVWVGRNDLIPGNREKDDCCDLYIGYDFSAMIAHGSKPQAPKEKPPVDTTADGFYSFYIGDTTGKGPTGMVGMDENLVNKTVEYLNNRDRNSEKPLFLYVTLMLPHPPYGIDAPFYGITDRSKLPPRRTSCLQLEGKPSMLRNIAEKQNMSNWTEEKWSELRGTYLDMVTKFDDLFGKLKKALVDNDLYDNTNLFVFSDHGDYTGDYQISEKCQNCFDDPVSNVPLIVKPAKGIDVKPRVSEALVELADLTETVSDLTGIKLSYHQFGKSLKHLFDKEEEHKDAVFCEGGRVHGEPQAMELGHGPESSYWPRLSTQASEGPEHTKAIMMRFDHYKYTYRLYEDDEFYDYKKDPYELHNAIHDEEYKDIITNAKIRMMQWLVETGDYVPNRRDKR
ncbi:MAG: sulfatase-like hydrolase/transferase [Erysipelotrichaceae bacterium]|nr:sulfatase-like hydrolase/transferase [Erysipelotrichaceae bacterium]